MILGLVNALRGIERTPKWLDRLALVCAVVGIAYSLYDFGGVTTLNQVLELGVISGVLTGTYLLAKQRPAGYLWYMLMNGSTAALMGIQGYPWLVLQQVISFGFVTYAWYVQWRKIRQLSLSKSHTT
jgi:hypothetical protein